MVITFGFDPKDLGSIPSGTFTLHFSLVRRYGFHGVMVSTFGFDPKNLGSIPSETFFFFSKPHKIR